MKILQFLQDSDGQFSSKRLMSFLVVVSTIIDWQHAIWTDPYIWQPSYQTIAFVLVVLGIQITGTALSEKKSADPNSAPGGGQ